MTTATALTAREVYQVLKDVALGVRTLRRLSTQSWNEIHTGPMPVEVDGWTLTLFNDGDTLNYCDDATCPAGRVGTLDDWQRYGTNPVDLLSTWEHQQLQHTLANL
ncbi:hypothetical protein NUH87_28820 [Pseudomonas batumici]|uniref:DUF7693 family protein n=1 Tax=Pseudomonas batumici TaxID=226910 RepID=UPI0030D27F06